MTARSTAHMYVVSKDGTQRRWLRPGDDVPDWARIDNRNLEGGSQSADEEPDDAGDDTGPGLASAAVQAPARSGRGSSVDAWRAFAAQHGIDAPADASRDDIIAVCEQAGIIRSEG